MWSKLRPSTKSQGLLPQTWQSLLLIELQPDLHVENLIQYVSLLQVLLLILVQRPNLRLDAGSACTCKTVKVILVPCWEGYKCHVSWCRLCNCMETPAGGGRGRRLMNLNQKYRRVWSWRALWTGMALCSDGKMWNLDDTHTHLALYDTLCSVLPLPKSNSPFDRSDHTPALPGPSPLINGTLEKTLTAMRTDTITNGTGG